MTPRAQTGRRLRVLVVTQLFPNAADPTNAVFNRLQLAALARLCDDDLRAVIPWFPGARAFRRWSIAGRCATVPAEEVVDGLLVRHPRVLFVPRIGAAIAPALYVASLWPRVRRLAGRVDVVLGCWASPDGVAAVSLARRLGAAAVVKVHGSDLNVHARAPAARRALSLALQRADRVVAVSRPLAEKAAELGVARDRIALVRNGVDRELFRPRERRATRDELGLDPGGRWIVFVGLLDRAKGIAELITAFDRLAPAHPELRLAVIGEGREELLVRAAAARHPGRLIATGPLPAHEVARWLGACDVLALPSWAEGTPNVILEAFASGRRVVATAVGGIPDLVTSPALGTLVPPRDVPALADALARAAREDYDAAALTAAAPSGWDDSAALLLDVLFTAASSHPATRLGAFRGACDT